MDKFLLYHTFLNTVSEYTYKSNNNKVDSI